jgi:DUF1365 family protein
VNEAHNALYECRVMHHRLTPKEHRFSYRVFYLWLDLDELEALDGSLRAFSRNRWNLFSFFDRDHLDLGETTLKANILRWLREQDMDVSVIARIRLLTFPRVLGYIFNPVCFYFCLDEQGEALCAIAEVTNTFHEQKPYLLRERDADGRFRLLTPKHFYVSPFSALDLNFDFKLGMPSENVEIHIDDREGDRRVFLSALTGKRAPLTDGRLLWFMVKYPLLTLRVIFLIHWHAFLLWCKRLPVHRKAAQPEMQRDVLRPHPSITQIPKP